MDGHKIKYFEHRTHEIRKYVAPFGGRGSFVGVPSNVVRLVRNEMFFQGSA